jgi:Glycosyl hydrolase family 12
MLSRRWPAFVRSTILGLGLLTAVLWSCSVGTTQADTCETDGCILEMSPDIYVTNNQWGNAGNGGGTITVNGGTSWSTNWDFDAPTDWVVISYPAAILGWQWGYRSPNTGFPVQLSSHTPIHATAAFTYVPDPSCSVSRVCRLDIAYDAWFHGTNNPGTSDPVYEMMIWLAYSRELFSGTPARAYAILGGHRWKVIETQGGSTPVATFLLDEPADLTGATLNITDFTDWLVNNHWVPATWWIDSLQFGTEIFNGKGTLHVPCYTASVGGLPTTDCGQTSTAPGGFSPPAFTVAGASAAPRTAGIGQAVTLGASVTAGAAASNIIVDLEVHDAAGQKIAQEVYSGQRFAAGQTLAYTWSWPGAPAAGTYHFVVAVLDASWSTLYTTVNPAAAVAIEAPAAAGFTVGTTSAAPSPVVAGQTVSVGTSVRAGGAASGIVVDVGIWNAAGTRVAQQAYTGQSFTASQTKGYTWPWAVPPSLPAGAYRVSVAVFDASWSQLHVWIDAAATFTVQTPATVGAPVTAGFTVGATAAAPSPVSGGQTVTIGSAITGRAAASGVIVDIGIYNAQGQRIAQKAFAGQGFTAGQTRSYNWAWAVGATGTYTVKIGVFDASWTTPYIWVDSAATFTVR